MKNQKKFIREKIKKLRSELSEEELIKKSNKVFYNFKNFKIIQDSKNIMIYKNLPSEVKTEKLIEYLFNLKKIIIVPSIIENEIKSTLLEEEQDFEKNIFGIKEPKKKTFFEKTHIDIIITPGVAFDYKGMRVGFGKAYYDNFLKNYKGIKIGLCFEFQIFEDLKKEKHDILIDYIITNERIIKCKN